jgi:hypothetical protein
LIRIYILKEVVKIECKEEKKEGGESERERERERERRR